MDYESIAKDPKLAKKVIEDSYFSSSDPVKNWEEARKLISIPIDESGSILDIGCANGFLLRSLEYWSQKELNSYGIDTEAKNIENAKDIFPNAKDHFLHMSFIDLIKNYPSIFPEKFDYILWAVWVNFNIKKDHIEFLLKHLTEGGKLVLAFYPDNSADPSDVLGNEQRLVSLGYDFEKILNEEFPNRNEKLLVIRETSQHLPR